MSRKEPQSRNRAVWEQQQAEQGGTGELEILDNVHLDALSNDKDIRNMIKTPELQQLIASIDGSRCRLEALVAAQHNVPQFDKFCEHVLAVIYGAEDAKRSGGRKY